MVTGSSRRLSLSLRVKVVPFFNTIIGVRRGGASWGHWTRIQAKVITPQIPHIELDYYRQFSLTIIFNFGTLGDREYSAQNNIIAPSPGHRYRDGGNRLRSLSHPT